MTVSGSWRLPLRLESLYSEVDAIGCGLVLALLSVDFIFVGCAIGLNEPYVI